MNYSHMSGPTSEIRVLLVHDDPAPAALARALERDHADATVPAATTVEDGLDRLHPAEVDCVACVHAGDVDGFAFLDAAGERYPNLPVVLFTDEGDEELAARALRAGADDYLPLADRTDGYGRLADRITAAIGRADRAVSYRAVFEEANIGLTVRDMDTGELLDVNERYCEMLGYDREEALELSLAEITADVPGYTAERAHEQIDRAAEAGSHSFEWPDRTAAGEVLWTEVGLRVAEIGGNERILATVRDITGRKEREEALRESEERFRTLFERSVDAIFIHDTDGRIIDVNRHAAENLGYDRDDLVGRYIWDVSATDRAELQAFLDRLSPDEVVTTEATHERADGSTFPVEVRVGLVDLPGDEQYVAIARDVTERKERERELERKNERLEEFAGVVSHDLRSPLNVIAGRIDLAREAGGDEHLAAIERAADRMERMIDGLLTLAREGKAIEDPEPVAVGDAARRAWEAVATGDATLEVDDAGAVVADRESLTRLLENLFRNAVEHGSTCSRPADETAVEHGSTSPRSQAPEDAVEHGSTCSRPADETAVERGSTGPHPEGEDAVAHDPTSPRRSDVTVRVGPIDDGTGFYVADDGPGVPPGEREAVFERRYSTSDDGLGFGLSIVRDVARAHGWTVDLTGAEAGGARFEIRGVERP